MNKVLDSVWFTQMGGQCIGIVMVQTEYDGIVFYIGNGVGHSQENDEARVAEKGARFPWHAGAKLFNMETTK